MVFKSLMALFSIFLFSVTIGASCSYKGENLDYHKVIVELGFRDNNLSWIPLLESFVFIGMDMGYFVAYFIPELIFFPLIQFCSILMVVFCIGYIVYILYCLIFD